MPTCQALLKAISAGRPRQVRLLLDSGTSIDEVDECGQTPLIRAVLLENDRSRKKILRMLLRSGATVSKSDVVDRNALTWSCIYGRDVDTATLLENADLDIDLNYADINGQTALYHAVSSGNAACVKLMVDALLKYGLSVDITDYNGISPLMNAVRLGFDVCASILIRNGNAKVGLGMKFPRDFVKVEKWATHSLRDREKIAKKPHFLPLLTSSQQNKNYHPDSAAVRLPARSPQFSIITDEDSASDFDDNISSNNSVSNSFRSNVAGCLNLSDLDPPRSKPVSITSSTIAQPSSDDDVDSFSTPCGDDSVFHKSPDLSKLYGIIQEQITSSYRKTAKEVTPRTPNMDNAERTFVSEKSNVTTSSVRSRKGKKGIDANKWRTLKKNLRLVRQCTYESDSMVSSPWKLTTEDSFISDSSAMPETKRSELPTLNDSKKVNQKSHGNYSHS